MTLISALNAGITNEPTRSSNWIDGGRYCAVCGKEFFRRPDEAAKDYKQRKSCGEVCSAKAAIRLCSGFRVTPPSGPDIAADFVKGAPAAPNT